MVAYGIGQTIKFLPCGSFFSSPNLSRRRLDVCHTSTHGGIGVALVRITLCLKKGHHPTTNDNFNNGCPIPVIFGTNIAE